VHKLVGCTSFVPRPGADKMIALPPSSQWRDQGTGCPNHDASYCLNNNKPYETIEQAWIACAQISECGNILRYEHDGRIRFYVRRSDDPPSDSGQTIQFGKRVAAGCPQASAAVSSVPAKPQVGEDCGEGPSTTPSCVETSTTQSCVDAAALSYDPTEVDPQMAEIQKGVLAAIRSSCFG
jgi:hypothetical protein